MQRDKIVDELLQFYSVCEQFPFENTSSLLSIWWCSRQMLMQFVHVVGSEQMKGKPTKAKKEKQTHPTRRLLLIGTIMKT